MTFTRRMFAAAAATALLATPTLAHEFRRRARYAQAGDPGQRQRPRHHDQGAERDRQRREGVPGGGHPLRDRGGGLQRRAASVPHRHLAGAGAGNELYRLGAGRDLFGLRQHPRRDDKEGRRHAGADRDGAGGACRRHPADGTGRPGVHGDPSLRLSRAGACAPAPAG